jgi:hypothetical protein
MAKNIGIGLYRRRTKVRRPGVHSKNNSSKNKKSKYYVKEYNGQGK